MATYDEALFEAPAAHAMAGGGELRPSWKQDGTLALEAEWEMAGGAQAGVPAAPVSYCRFPAHRRCWLRELAELLAFPSVSAQPEHRPDLEAAAVWLRDHLTRIGLRGVHVLPGADGGLPSVYGEWLDAPGRPTLLLYGHYDVQPAGPLHEWHSPPFQATVSGDRLVARGASDDKGQLFIHLKALESWLRTAGRLPLNVKVWLEGEEEIGSPSIDDVLAREAGRLRADAVLVSDTEMATPDRPAIVSGLRGLLVCELEVRGASRDLHDGRYGGAAPNPLHALATMIAGLHDRWGQVALPGFYQRVRDVHPRQSRGRCHRTPPDAHLIGARTEMPRWADARYTATERATIRPALTVTGLSGGSTGAGAKGAIPHRAVARISIRLVPEQEPGEIAGLLRRYVAATTPPVVRSRLTVRGSARPVLVPGDHPAIFAAVRAVTAVWGAPPVVRRSGGSIPSVAALQRRLGATPILLGFGLPDDHAHGPNERLSLPTFFSGVETVVQFFGEYGRT